jgi:hypothetical protein
MRAGRAEHRELVRRENAVVNPLPRLPEPGAWARMTSVAMTAGGEELDRVRCVVTLLLCSPGEAV